MVEVDQDYSTYVHARWAGLVRSAMLLGCSRQEAEDLTQTALVRCYTSWPKVIAAADPEAYVYRVLVNCLAKSRKRRWWGELPTAEVLDRRGSLDDSDAASMRMTVSSALARLSERRRAVVVLRFYADFSEAQVAQILDIPVGTVKSRTSRALDELAEFLDLTELRDF